MCVILIVLVQYATIQQSVNTQHFIVVI